MRLSPTKHTLLSKKVVFACIGICLAGYSIYQTRFLLFGYTLRIYTPRVRLTTTSEPSLLFSGNAYRSEALSLNGDSVSISSKGYFEKKISLPPGETHYILRSKNVFGKEEVHEFVVIYTTPQ